MKGSESSYAKAIEGLVEREGKGEKRGELAKTAALTFFEMNRLKEGVEMLETGRRAGGGDKATKDIEGETRRQEKRRPSLSHPPNIFATHFVVADTMAAMFIGNSALWLDPSVAAYFATADGIKVAKDFCAYLAKSLKEEEDQGWKELLAYAKASVEYGILKNKENAEAIIREYVLVGGQTVKPSAAETKAKADIKSFKVLTVATDRRPALDNLIRSAKVRTGEINPRK